MSYYVQSLIVMDAELHYRITACVATLGEPYPLEWAGERVWRFSAQPGWAEAYEQAITDGIENPGRDGQVISDAMILAAVTELREEDGA